MSLMIFEANGAQPYASSELIFECDQFISNDVRIPPTTPGARSVLLAGMSGTQVKLVLHVNSFWQDLRTDVSV